MKHRFLAALAALVLPLTVLVAVPATASASSSAGMAALAEWAPYTAYTVGQRVTYQGVEYECRQSHTSLPGWEPPNVPALWLPTDGGGSGDTQAPSVPGNLRSTGVTASSISLAWNAS